MFTHHAGQGQQSGLDLSHVPIFKQVIGLKNVIGLEAIVQEGFDKIPNVFQLQRETKTNRVMLLAGTLSRTCGWYDSSALPIGLNSFYHVPVPFGNVTPH